MLSFFLSGLPGGLDYFMLALVKHGWLSSDSEKKYNARVMVGAGCRGHLQDSRRPAQVWIRSPGCMLCAYSIYSSWRYRMVAGAWADP
jgi:hypothetical protein